MRGWFMSGDEIEVDPGGCGGGGVMEMGGG